VLALLYLLRWWQQSAEEPAAAGKKLSLKHCLVSLAALAAIGRCYWAMYGPETLRSLKGPALNDEIREAGSATPSAPGCGRWETSSIFPRIVSAGLNRWPNSMWADITRICWGRGRCSGGGITTRGVP